MIIFVYLYLVNITFKAVCDINIIKTKNFIKILNSLFYIVKLNIFIYLILIN